MYFALTASTVPDDLSDDGRPGNDRVTVGAAPGLVTEAKLSVVKQPVGEDSTGTTNAEFKPDLEYPELSKERVMLFSLPYLLQ